ncbi:hypothetical protein [Burkholderia ubonensis]|nr:hypothetical protein [Burkholderia ubonensis]
MSEVKGDFNGEVIDALGIRAGVYAECSIVIECKTSRADYLADAKKPHRINREKGMGQYRYFMAPEGMLKFAELPHGWGLIEVTEKGQIRPRRGHVFLRHDDPDTWAHPHNKGAEWTLLARMLNRVGDVEVLQNRLKEAMNTKARLAKSNDLMRKQLDDMGRDLFLARTRLEEAGLDTGFAAPTRRARPKRVAACEMNDPA